MSKIKNDKYYTPVELAKKLIDVTISVIGFDKIDEVIEPSAGNGSFGSLLKHYFSSVTMYDIDPEGHNIIQQDYLQLEEVYKKNKLYIGNPPFGDRNRLSIQLLKKNMLYGDYIAYIQPISQYKNSIQFYEFDLIYSEDLGTIDYSGIKLHCCFNIWKRPDSGVLNPKPSFKLKEVEIKEFRRNVKNKNNHSCYNTESIKPDFDYCMCNWGNSSLGKIPLYIGEYAQEVYFYVKNKDKVDSLKRVLEFNTIRSYCQNISMKKISVARLYQYLKEKGFD